MSDPHADPDLPESDRPDSEPPVFGGGIDDLSPTLPDAERNHGLGSLDPRELIEAGLASRTSPLRWEPPSAEDLHRLLPQYEIESILGRGGMGAVYKGRQAALDRPVAIKLLPAEVAADPEFVARFQREARTLARLQHPGIVLVHDFGQTAEGHLYFVMEFVDGTDLYKIIHGPGLECVQALEIVAQICDALQYAHTQGVVHRDIKPANVILTQDGRTKLADFGLARPLDDGSGAFTRSNVVMGTPDYMAPEALAGEADHRADLYSLGVMLYEMLTGKPPRGAWAPPSQRVQVDVRLDEVVLRALQEDPEMRYQQASEIKTDVEVIRTTPLPKAGKGKGKARPKPGTAPAPAAKSVEAGRKRSLVGIASVGVAVAVGFGLFGQWALKDREGKEDGPETAGGADGATVKPETVIQPEPQVIAARERGGRLRVFGSGPTGTFEIGEAAQFDDFTQVVVNHYGWAARRSNGETWCGAWGHGENPTMIPFGPYRTRYLNRSYMIHMLMEEPGVSRNIWSQESQEIDGIPPYTERVIAVNNQLFALGPRGEQTKFRWHSGTHDIPDFFQAADIMTGTHHHFICSRPGEAIKSWSPTKEESFTFPESTKEVVEVDGADQFVALRYADGRVQLVTPDGLPLPDSLDPKVEYAPSGDERFVAVRAGRGMAAAQRPDGSWKAWGESEKLSLEVAKLAHVVDLDFHYDGKHSGLLMWIEPVEGAETTGLPSTEATWQPITWHPRDYAENLAEGDDGWVKSTHPGDDTRSIRASIAGSPQAYALRFPFRWGTGEDVLAIGIKKADEFGHTLILRPSEIALVESSEEGEKIVATQSLSQTLAPGTEGTIKIAFLDDRRIVARLNERTLIDTPITRVIAKGNLWVEQIGEISFRDVETLNLDDVPDPLAALGWDLPETSAATAPTQRQVAEHFLAAGATLNLTYPGKKQPRTEPGDALPEEDFDIIGITYHVGDAATQPDFDLVAHAPKLETLSYYGQLTSLAPIADLVHLNFLRVLSGGTSGSEFQFDESEMRHLANLHQLEYLHISHFASFSGEGCRHLANAKNLRSLRLGHGKGENLLPLTEAGAVAISNLTSLESLSLAGAAFDATNFGALKTVTSLPNLTRFELNERCVLTPELFSAIADLSKIGTLSFWNAELQTQDFSLLAPCGDTLEQLVFLYHSNLSDVGLRHIAASLPNLKKLQLGEDNTCTEAGIAVLKAALPACEVIGGGGPGEEPDWDEFGILPWKKAGWGERDLSYLASDGWMTSPNTLQSFGPMQEGSRSQVKFKDGAIRAKFRNDGTDQISLYFHALESGAPIALQLFENELVAKIAPAGKREEHIELGRITFDSPFRQGDAELIEAAVVGQTYVVRFKGHELRFEVSEPTSEGIANFHGRDFSVRDVEYVILDGTDEPWKALGWEVPEQPNTSSNPLWQKSTWNPADLPMVSADGWFTVGELRSVDPRQNSGRGAVAFRDGGVRAHVRLETGPSRFGTGVGLWLRLPLNQAISFGISESELVAKRHGEPEAKELGRIAFDTPFRPGDVEPIETVAVGDTFIARFKGKELRVHSPEANQSGQVSFHGRNFSVKDIEYAILDGIADPWKALGWEAQEERQLVGDSEGNSEAGWKPVPIPEGKQISAEGWWTYGSGDRFFSGPAHRDLRFQNGGVRFEFRPPAEGSPNLQIRQSSPSPGVFCFLSADGNIRLTYRDEEWRHTFSDWNSGQPNMIELAAVGKAVRIRMNDEVFQATLTELTPAGVFGFGIQKDRAGIELRNLEYLNLDGHTEAEARQLLGWDIESVETDSAEPWHDFLAELAEGPHKNVQLGRVWVPENGNWRVAHTHAFRIPDEVGRDLALRITGVMADGKGPAGTPHLLAASLREKPGASGYTGILFNTGNAYLRRGAEDLKRFDLGPDFDPAASHTLELRAVGNRLTLLVDGIEQGSVIDATLSAGGRFGIGASEGGLIEKAEYQWLSDPPAAAEPIVWQNFLAEIENGPHRNQQLGRVWEREGAAWRVKHYHVFTIPDEAGRDLAIRATGSGSLGVFVRGNGEAGYAGWLFDSVGRARIQINEEILREYRIPRDEDGSKMSTIELRAVGNTLTLFIDDVELGSVQDESLVAGGSFGVNAGEGSLVEKVEYRFLGDAAPTNSSASRSGDPVVDEIVAWVFKNQGSVSFNQRDRGLNAKTLEQIPPGRFDLIGVHLPGEQVTDAEFAMLGSVKTLRRIEFNGVSHITSLKPIAGLTELSNLWLPENEGLAEEELVHLAGMTNLGSLRIKLPGATGEGFRHLQRLPKLKLLSLNDAEFTEEGAREIAGLAQLDSLLLAGCVREANQKSLIPIGRMSNLTSLDIEGMLTVEGFAALAPLELTHLDLSSSKFDNAGFPLLTGSRDSLTELEMAWGATVSDEGIRHIVANFPNIERTCASYGSTCTGASLRELAKLPKLKSISWWVKGMQTADYVLLADLPVIEHIGVGFGTDITDEALPAFAKCEHLKELSLRETAITDSGLKALQDIRPLETVDLQGTKITPAGLAEFQKARPDVQVSHGFGATSANAPSPAPNQAAPR